MVQAIAENNETQRHSYRNSCSMVFFRIAVQKSFAKSIGKFPEQLFLIVTPDNYFCPMGRRLSIVYRKYTRNFEKDFHQQGFPKSNRTY